MGRYTVSGSGADCKSAAFGLGWFDSISAHQKKFFKKESLSYGNQYEAI